MSVIPQTIIARFLSRKSSAGTRYALQREAPRWTLIWVSKSYSNLVPTTSTEFLATWIDMNFTVEILGPYVAQDVTFLFHKICQSSIQMQVLWIRIQIQLKQDNMKLSSEFPLLKRNHLNWIKCSTNHYCTSTLKMFIFTERTTSVRRSCNEIDHPRGIRIFRRTMSSLSSRRIINEHSP